MFSLKRGTVNVIRHQSYRKPAQRCGFADLVSSSAELVQSLHATTGLPWWAFIPMFTFGFRAITTLPIAISQRIRLRKQNSLRPLITATGPILRMKLAAHAQSQAQARQLSKDPLDSLKETLSYEKIVVLAAKENRKRQKVLFKKNGCQVWKSVLLPAVQIPVWLSLSFTFRSLTGWQGWHSSDRPLDPSLSREGFGWVTDLTYADPYTILPIVLEALALVNIEWNNRTLSLMRLTSKGKGNSRPTMFDAMINTSRIGVVFLMVVSSQAPAALSLYWISSNVFSLLQNVALDRLLPISYSPYMQYSKKTPVADAVSLVPVRA
ncbi:unnamed protein product [Kuraishia capsulata CBS 1993]|uniref:Membrane insertase YidC/Oxa/ALB C-terminal domain-containing protein n=1 Tax=Kuraishia capsulata CBS 1993 TaxID=1382522 RepID=W6MSM4_9ASCO|nr:uncharacterized protein KUCA_T00005804001 [Kuraishia capsulata CBS 1993]CDK29811.1 unnamed protein product [Kuraishia capsulata CBS 1993]